MFVINVEKKTTFTIVDTFLDNVDRFLLYLFFFHTLYFDTNKIKHINYGLNLKLSLVSDKIELGL
jgi:hypothetical protein